MQFTLLRLLSKAQSLNVGEGQQRPGVNKNTEAW